MSIWDSLSGLFGGLFGDSGAPYDDAMKQYRKWATQGQNVQNPFVQFGQRGIPGFEEWLQGQKDPSQFINNLMGQYKESPWAKYQQDQAMRAAQNMGSAKGLTGSTPLAQFAEQQAAGISSQDMQNWLAQVLGINTQYGEGLNRQIGTGQNSANTLTNMYGDLGSRMGGAAFGKRYGQQYDDRGLWGGLFDLGSDLYSHYFP